MNILKRRFNAHDRDDALTDVGHWKVTGNWRDMPQWQIIPADYTEEEKKIQRGEEH